MSNLWVCHCGDTWADPGHQNRINPGRSYRSKFNGNPAEVVPYRQWIRENLPPSSDRFVVAADDGIARTWTASDPVGHAIAMEWKSNGAALDVPTGLIFEALDQSRYLGSLTLSVIDGNVPTPVQHYPLSCPCCDYPEPPVVGTGVRVSWRPHNGDALTKIVPGGDVARIILRCVGHEQWPNPDA